MVEQPQDPRTVMVLRFSALGDILLTTPAIDALRKALPSTRIIYVTKAQFLPLLKHNPNITELVGVSREEPFPSLVSRLNAFTPDVMLDLHGKMRSKILRGVVKAPRSVVWTKRRWQDTLPVKLRLKTYRAEMLLSDRFHDAVEELVGRELPRGDLRHFVGDDDQARADGILREAGVDLARPIVGMSPGANWFTKRWPAEHFRELARRVVTTEAQVILTGSAAESDLGKVISEAGAGVFDLSGKLDIPALGGAISRCRAFVANDSGPMHMARGLGVPTLAFFGSTDPGQFEFNGHATMFAGLECSPCSFYGLDACPKGHLDCLKKLEPEAAFDALRPLLDGKRRLYVHA